jgi:hypothetical protein
MSEKKSITIDPNSLLGGGSGGTSKRKSVRRSNGDGSGERKIRPSSIVQPSTLKRTLLERIKQHQRTRERSREESVSAPATQAESMSGGGGGGGSDNFSQSIDFLRKLAMKRRQMTQKHRPSSAASTSNANTTQESQILNKVAETLHHGEIVTNTGLLGLPVVPMLVPEQQQHSSVPTPSISVGPMPMPMQTPFAPEVSTFSSVLSLPENLPPPPPAPKITELAEMYNNTVASAPSPVTEPDSSTVSTASDAPFHIPQKSEDFLPSIFIKDEPPHGCLKNGKKPTFREWASKILGPGVPTPNDVGASGGAMIGGSGGDEKSTTSPDIKTYGASSGIDPSQIAGMRVKIRKTHKKRYRIGKHDDVVGVLLKNKQTQRHIQSQHLTLRQKTIGEIRKYLYDHHLLKIGSNAPPDVLRRMYEDAILTGDVKNTNDGVMLHNFMSGGGSE